MDISIVSKYFFRARTAWFAGFPPPGLTIPDPMPAWVNALNAAVAAGKIPDIPVSSNSPSNLNPVYPNGLNPSSPAVCSGTYKCRIPGDIWDAPPGVFAGAVDDGPSPVSCFFYFASFSIYSIR